MDPQQALHYMHVIDHTLLVNVIARTLAYLNVLPSSRNVILKL